MLNNSKHPKTTTCRSSWINQVNAGTAKESWYCTEHKEVVWPNADFEPNNSKQPDPSDRLRAAIRAVIEAAYNRAYLDARWAKKKNEKWQKNAEDMTLQAFDTYLLGCLEELESKTEHQIFTTCGMRHEAIPLSAITVMKKEIER